MCVHIHVYICIYSHICIPVWALLVHGLFLWHDTTFLEDTWRDSMTWDVTHGYEHDSWMCNITHLYATCPRDMSHEWSICDISDWYVTWVIDMWHDVCIFDTDITHPVTCHGDVTPCHVTWVIDMWHDVCIGVITPWCITCINDMSPCHGTWHRCPFRVGTICDMTMTHLCVTWHSRDVTQTAAVQAKDARDVERDIDVWTLAVKSVQVYVWGWFCECAGVWVCECVCVWLYRGCVCVWMCVCVDVCVCGCVSGFVWGGRECECVSE